MPTGIQPLPGSEPLQKEYNRLIRQYRRELKTGAVRYDLLAQAAELKVRIYHGEKAK